MMRRVSAAEKEHLQTLLWRISQIWTSMCERRSFDCPVCGREYLIFVKYCPHVHPPESSCPQEIIEVKEIMTEGHCPSPLCPNSRSGGCVVS